MKRLLLGILLGLHISTTFGMESAALVESYTINNPLYMAELRLLITKFLWAELSIEDALKTIRAWALTDTTGWKFYQKQETAQGFIDYFNKLSYYNGYAIALLQNYKALLDQEELALFNQSLQTGTELVKLFDTCAEEKKWDAFLTQVPVLEKARLSKYLAHYYWESTYREFYAQKTLLVYALELQAPQEVIDALMRWGSRRILFNKKTPSPCLLVCQNILNVTADYEKQQKEQNADLESLKEKFEPLLKDLKDSLDKLIKKGCSIQECFFGSTPGDSVTQYITPISIATEASNQDLVTYLHEKGSYVTDHEFYSLVEEFAKNKISLFTMESYLRAISTSRLQYFFRFLLTRTLDDRNKEEHEENYCKLIAWFLNQNIDINAVEEGLTVLDIANQTDNKNSKITALLIENGALSAINPQVASLIAKTQSLYEGAPDEYKTKVFPLLEEVKMELLNNEHLVIHKELVYEWLTMALNISPSEQGKQFWKFVALRFPEIPLFKLAVGLGRQSKITYIKNKERYPDLNNKELYNSNLNKIQDLLFWLLQEGIKDSGTPTAIDLAKEFGMEELVILLKEVMPNN